MVMVTPFSDGVMGSGLIIDFVKSRYQLKIFQGTSIWGNPIGPIRYFMPGSVFYLRGPIHGKVYDENHGIIPFTPVIKGVTQ